ncbi:hypothetical protein SLS57_002069 [Botryosphaeria dothidea]
MNNPHENQTRSLKAKEATEKDSLYSRQSIDTLPRYTENVETSQQGASIKQKSKISATLDHVKAKMTREPETPERAAAKAAEKARREEEYKRLGLGERTKFGVGGTSWSG